MPWIACPFLGSNFITTSTIAGNAIVRPMATTSPATGAAVLRCRKTSHSRTTPSSGASMTTDTMNEGMIGQPHSVWSLEVDHRRDIRLRAERQVEDA